MNSGLTSADSGLQVNLEIALSGASAKVQPHGILQPGQRRTETSGDVIGDEFTSTADGRQLDFSPMRLGVAKTTRESAKPLDEFEALGVGPVFGEKQDAIDYAQGRARFRIGEIRILDSNGKLERAIAFSEANRML